MNFDEEVYEKLLANHELLCNIIRQNTSEPQMKVDLSRIGKMIHKKIPDTLKRMRPRISMNCIPISSPNTKSSETSFCMTS